MEFQSPGQPDPGAPTDFRRSVGQATDRIHEIVDAAERLAAQIRADAEAEAREYLERRKAEADALAAERDQALDELTRKLADTAEQFKHQAARMLADLDSAIVDARAGVYRRGSLASVESEPPPAPPAALDPQHSPLPKLEFESKPSPEPQPAAPEPAPAPEPEPVRAERPRPAIVSAYPGRGEQPQAAPAATAGADQTSEALIRATQLAVTGKDRDEIADVLRADFPSVQTDALLDEILG
jgi:outer membrane biosynthesis protein TonB